MTLAVESAFSAEAGVRYTWEVGVTPKDKLHRSVMSPQTQIFESHKLGTEDDDEETSHTVVVELTQTGAYSLVLTEERFDGAKMLHLEQLLRVTFTASMCGAKYGVSMRRTENVLDAAHTQDRVYTPRPRRAWVRRCVWDITSLSLIHNDLAEIYL